MQKPLKHWVVSKKDPFLILCNAQWLFLGYHQAIFRPEIQARYQECLDTLRDKYLLYFGNNTTSLPLADLPHLQSQVI